MIYNYLLLILITHISTITYNLVMSQELVSLFVIFVLFVLVAESTFRSFVQD